SPVDPAALPNPADQLRPGLEAATTDFPVFRKAPRIIRETLLFPYVAGSRFVQALWRSQPETERSAPMGAFLPQSTEQVLNPIGRFVEMRDEPTELRLADEPAPGGAGNTAPSDPWTAEYENVLGRLEVGLFLEEHLGIGADSAAEGWDGDRFRLLRSRSGERALVWYSIWDDDASADRFAHAVREILTSKLDRAGSVTRIPIDGRPGVRVTLARRGMTEDIAAPGVRIAH
ncbi:MAG: hypothetical protein L0271_06655, partial [Gemmatimonadetes bacterium]|nr:hypothetical protein [Gemmatimonadota bacterium]